MKEIIGSALVIIKVIVQAIPSWYRKWKIKKILKQKDKLAKAKDAKSWWGFLK